MSEYKDLCKWLRDHSSGVYRKSAEAAEVIENLEAKRDALQAKIKQLEAQLEEERQENASLRSGDDYDRGAE